MLFPIFSLDEVDFSSSVSNIHDERDEADSSFVVLVVPFVKPDEVLGSADAMLPTLDIYAAAATLKIENG